MNETPMENVFQLGLIDLLFEIVTLFINTLTGVIIPGVLTPLLEAVFGIFQ